MRKTMKTALMMAVILLPGMCDAASARTGWDPRHTWVFAVGILQFQDSASFGSFPQKYRRDQNFLALLRAQGVAAEHITYLCDAQATRARIQASFDALLARTGSNDLMLVYYAGHGTRSENGEEFLVPYDANGDRIESCWSTSAIFSAIDRRFQGSRVLLLADCCYSGGLVQAVRQHTNPRVAMAALTSSQASSSSTGAWTFTESIIDGFSGNPQVDLNHDGVITLAELAAYTEAEMAFGDEQLSAFAASARWPADTVIAQAHAAAPGNKVGERVEAASSGKWWRAKVIAQDAQRYKVHYYDWDSDDDEWVTVERLRPLQVKRYDVGQGVDVEWNKKWYPAKVQGERLGIYYIHYDGYDKVWDEWVGVERMRERPP